MQLARVTVVPFLGACDRRAVPQRGLMQLVLIRRRCMTWLLDETMRVRCVCAACALRVRAAAG